MAAVAVVFIGLGDVAGAHLAVLERMPLVDVVAGIDPACPTRYTFRGRPLQVYPNVRDIPTGCQPDLVVVATPTPTHASVCDQVREAFPTTRILVEKPAADNAVDAHRLLNDDPAIEVAYHMAYSPEVSWAKQIVDRYADGLGTPTSIVASFSDPYSQDFAAAAARMGNSWFDSGINALSVLHQIVDIAERTSLRQIGATADSTFEAHLTCRCGDTVVDALLLTSWRVTDPAKTTRVRYSDNTELVMDHTAVAGYLVRHGDIAEVFGLDRGVPRRERHYQALYQSLLVDGQSIYRPQTSRHLHELLLGRTSDQ